MLVSVELRVLPVSLSVGPLETTVYCAKMTGMIELLFGVVGRVGPRNDVLYGGSDLPKKKQQILGGNRVAECNV